MLDTLALLGGVLILSKILGGLAQKISIPSVLAELLTGVIIGNLGLEIFTQLGDSEITRSLSEIGVILLLFVVGLETDFNEMKSVGKDAFLVALLGVIAPFILAFIFIPVLMETSFQHTLFMAAALTATSVGITARVLHETNQLKSISGRIIIGAAVIDDVMGIIILTVVTAIVTQGSVSVGDLGALAAKIVGFGIIVFIIRKFILKRALYRISAIEVTGTVTVLLFSFAMIISWGAEKAGLAGIIGAFALGIVLDELHFEGFREKGGVRLDKMIKPLTDFLVPVFFISMGMQVKLGALFNKESIILALALIVVAIIGKIVCGLAISRKSLSEGADRLFVGYGMIPRGEVGLIFAAMGLKLKVMGTADYSAVVAMVAVTTLMAPVLLYWRSNRIVSKEGMLNISRVTKTARVKKK